MTMTFEIVMSVFTRPPPTFSSCTRCGEPSLRNGWISIVTPLSRSPSRSITRSTGWLRNASISARFDAYCGLELALELARPCPCDAERDAWPAATFSIL